MGTRTGRSGRRDVGRGIGATGRRVSGQVRRRMEAVLDELPGVSARVDRARRDLAARIEPAPRRRRPRILVIGLLVTAVGAVVWALLERRAAADRDRTPPAPVPDERAVRTTPPGGAVATDPTTSAAGGAPR